MNEKILALPVVKQLSNSVTQRQLEQLPVIVISHPKVSAALSLQGAHLLFWQPHDAKNIIWLSNNTAFKEGTAIRGGVPICWPWFGLVAQPSHGFARLLPWILTASEELHDSVILTLILKDNEQSRKYWPHAFTLIARFKLSEKCDIELESHGSYKANAALHTYFQVGDISQIKISGLGSHYLDKVHNRSENNPQDELIFKGPIDRVYSQPGACSVIEDLALERTIEVHHHNHSDVVIWNPGVEQSRKMTDMPDDGYKTLVCIETARINKPLIATQGTPARLAMTICNRKKNRYDRRRQ